jgi:outer membrane protein
MRAAALVAALAAGVAAAATPAGAQTGDTIQLTLEDALGIARGSSPAYRQAVNSSGLNQSAWQTTLLTSLVPSVNLSVFSTDYYGNIQRQATDFFGNPIANPSAEWVTYSNTNQQLALNWSIQGSDIFNALNRQRLENRSRLITEARALIDLEVAVEREFWALLEQDELLRAEEELLAASEIDRDVTERLFRLGSRSRVDVLTAELAVEQRRLSLRRQEAEVERAKLALRARLGDDRLPPFEPAAAELPDFDPTGLDADALVRMALAVNPSMESASVSVEQAQLEVRDAGRLWWPRLSVGYSIGRRAQTRQSDALFDLSFDEDLDQRFSIGLSIPMFGNYFQNRQSQRQASVTLENQTEAERGARLELEQSVRGAHLALEYQWDNLRISERAAEIASEALELAREEYRLGSSTFQDLRQSIDSEADARRQVIQARHAAANTLLDLEAAVGTRLRN